MTKLGFNIFRYSFLIKQIIQSNIDKVQIMQYYCEPICSIVFESFEMFCGVVSCAFIYQETTSL